MYSLIAILSLHDCKFKPARECTNIGDAFKITLASCIYEKYNGGDNNLKSIAHRTNFILLKYNLFPIVITQQLQIISNENLIKL